MKNLFLEDPDVPSTSSVPSVPQPQLDIPMRTEVEFKETESWCTLSYYEMNQRCGKAFEGKFLFYNFLRVSPWLRKNSNMKRENYAFESRQIFRVGVPHLRQLPLPVVNV